MNDISEDIRDRILADQTHNDGALDTIDQPGTAPVSTIAQQFGILPSAEKRAKVRTLTDLARLAGVSAGTVSRALAGKSLVNVETRQRIQNLARQHGFRPNQIASKLRSQRTGVIGVVIPLAENKQRTISDPFFLTLLGHLARQVTDIGYDLMLCRAIPDGTSDWLERVTASGMVDGVLVVGQADQFDVIEHVAGYYQPMVVWGHHRPGQQHCTIGTDNFEGGHCSVQHLINSGARRLAFLGEADGIEVATRYEGAIAAAQANNLSITHIPVTFANKTMGPQIAAALLASDADYDGLVCASDLIAMSALRILSENGRHVPDDVQIIGYDDLPLASQTRPPLTSVRQDIAEGARRMVAKLKRRIDGEHPQSVVMPPKLISRDSTKVAHLISELA